MLVTLVSGRGGGLSAQYGLVMHNADYSYANAQCRRHPLFKVVHPGVSVESPFLSQ